MFTVMWARGHNVEENTPTGWSVTRLPLGSAMSKNTPYVMLPGYTEV